MPRADRVKHPTLEERVELLEKQVEQLSQALPLLHNSQDQDKERASGQNLSIFAAESSLESPEVVVNWVERQAVLSRLATLCFLLVFALVLRTLTESKLLSVSVGTTIGLFYAAVLLWVGWYRYYKSSVLAPVFSTSGALLMFTILAETHNRYHVPGAQTAFLLLAATGVMSLLMGARFKAALPAYVGTLGMVVVSFVLGFPTPQFHRIVLLLWVANIAVYSVNELPFCRGLKWFLLFLTLVTPPIWRWKLSFFEKEVLPLDYQQSLAWFLPLLGLIATTSVVLSLVEIIRSREKRISPFYLILPTLSALWAFGGFHQVATETLQNSVMVGFHGILAAIVLIVIAVGLARLSSGLKGASAFIVAGVLLLDLALPLTTSDPRWPLPLLSLLAIGLIALSRKWNSGSVRVISYLVQIYLSVALMTILLNRPPGQSYGINVIVGVILAVFSRIQHFFARKVALPTTPFFEKFDRKDKSAVILFLSFLLNLYLVFRELIFQALIYFEKNTVGVFGCSQTTLINLAVIVLIGFAAKKRNTEYRNVAVFLTFIAALKLFLGDMLGAQGMPLVISVFSFGVAAAVESTLLSQWPRQNLTKN